MPRFLEPRTPFFKAAIHSSTSSRTCPVFAAMMDCGAYTDDNSPVALISKSAAMRAGLRFHPVNETVVGVGDSTIIGMIPSMTFTTGSDHAMSYTHTLHNVGVLQSNLRELDIIMNPQALKSTPKLLLDLTRFQLGLPIIFQ